MPNRIDLDLSADEPAASGADGLSWPSEIDQTWVVERIGEHDRRIATSEKRINDHAELLIAHDGVHEELRSGVRNVHSQMAEHAEMQKAHTRLMGQLYQTINAKQDAAATRQIALAERQEAMHLENHAALAQESQRSDWRTIITFVLFVAVIVSLLVAPK